jgi:hypothetical protein
MSGCRIAKVIQLYTLPRTGQQPLQVLRHLESSLAPKERSSLPRDLALTDRRSHERLIDGMRKAGLR